MICVNDCQQQVCESGIMSESQPMSTHQATRLVSFFPEVLEMKHILHVNDYTDDEYEACWFGPEELDRIMSDIWDTIDLMENKQRIDDKQFCQRGLEKMTVQGEDLACRNRQKARDTVLSVQAGVQNDSQLLAEAYNNCTQGSQDIAFHVGVSDAKIIFEHFLKNVKSLQDRTEKYHCCVGRSLHKGTTSSIPRSPLPRKVMATSSIPRSPLPPKGMAPPVPLRFFSLAA
jgi:hypothetical protein